jgi:hypothetical protein
VFVFIELLFLVSAHTAREESYGAQLKHGRCEAAASSSF